MTEKKACSLFLMMDIGILILMLASSFGFRKSPFFPLGYVSLGLVWILTSALCGKYCKRQFLSLPKMLETGMKANIHTLTILLFLMFGIDSFYQSRWYILSAISIFTMMDILLVPFLYMFLKQQNRQLVMVTEGGMEYFPVESELVSLPVAEMTNTDEVAGILPLPYQPAFEITSREDSIEDRLRRFYIFNRQDLFQFLYQTLDLSRFHYQQSLVMDTPAMDSLITLEGRKSQFFLNLHPINDCRRLNAYFITVNENLAEDGVFVFTAQTITERYEEFLYHYGELPGKIMYGIDFLIHRVTPKMPIIQKIYFRLTRGQNRALSEAEILGRMYFCGFEILDQKEIQGRMFFVFRKKQEPLRDEHPTYGPFIKLPRLGIHGKDIQVYKLRTMHPYSEYLQEYIYQRYNLSDSGKFQNDFRITSWGRIMRVWWVDELPQLINWLKGDLSLVGVRPVNDHFLSLYPEEIRNLRLKFKPGIFPPGVAEGIPDTWEGTVEAEQRYLIQKLKNRWRTDISYFFRILYMIIFKRVRGE